MGAKVSVIIPTYNRAVVLPRAIDSVLKQTFQDFELIVIDDGSTDDTPLVAKKYANHKFLHWVEQKNRGVSAARNQGIQKAQGSWIAFLDSDDEWLPQKLEKQMSFLAENPQFLWAHGDEIWIRRGVRVNPMLKHQKEGGDVFFKSLKLCCVSPSTVILKKNLFNQVGFFREDFPVCEDYDLWLKIASHYPVGFIGDFLIKKYGGHSDQLSHKFKAMDYWRVLSMFELLKKEQLSDFKSEQLKKEMMHKASLLLKGYRKHSNLSCYDQIFNIRKMIQS